MAEEESDRKVGQERESEMKGRRDGERARASYLCLCLLIDLHIFTLLSLLLHFVVVIIIDVVVVVEVALVGWIMANFRFLLLNVFLLSSHRYGLMFTIAVFCSRFATQLLTLFKCLIGLRL